MSLASASSVYSGIGGGSKEHGAILESGNGRAPHKRLCEGMAGQECYGVRFVSDDVLECVDDSA